MSRISAEMDIAHSYEALLREKLVYTPIGGLGGAAATKEVTAFIEGVPLGDLYNVNDVYLMQGDKDVAGEVYYVAVAEPGNPTLLLQPDVPKPIARPFIHVIDQSTWPEVDTERVLVGIRTKPESHFTPVQALFADRGVHADGNDVLLQQPFWEGGFYIHIEAGNRWDERMVSELLNSGLTFETRLYRFRVRFSPVRFELRNAELQGRFKSVLNANAFAEVTENTPIHDLPDGMPVVSYPYTNITGVSPVVEVYDDEPGEGYAEKVGDYAVDIASPDHHPAPNWPEEE